MDSKSKELGKGFDDLVKEINKKMVEEGVGDHFIIMHWLLTPLGHVHTVTDMGFMYFVSGKSKV